MDDIIVNKLMDYKENLYKAEADIENALRSICDIPGDFPRYELNEALEKVQDAIRGAWKFYRD